MSETTDIFDGATGTVPRESVEVRYDPDRGRSLSALIVLAVAAARGTDPRQVGPLGEVVDPDALDALFRGVGGTRPTGEVFLTLDGCKVLVRSDGWVLVRNPDAPTIG